MRRTGPLAGISFLLAGLVACGGEPTRPAVPTFIAVAPATVNLSALGAIQQLTATVRDQDSQPIAGLTTTFASSDLAVASVNGGGLVTAVDNGSATVTVSHGSLSVPVSVTVAQAVAQVAKVGGDQQTGLVGSELPIPVEVELRDANGSPVEPTADSVRFTAGQGGSVADSLVAVGSDGRAATLWTVGTGTGAQTLIASHNRGAAATQFGATALAAGEFTLEIRYLSGTNPTAAQQAAVDAAVALWEAVIVGDLSPVTVNVPANQCISGQPVLNETIDDIIVFVGFVTIDGPGGTLAQAGRCDGTPPLRVSTDSLPAIGVLLLDASDVTALQSDGTLDEVITHELGHTLGFSGEFFALKGLLTSPSLPSSPGVDTHFSGALAIARMDAIGGVGYPSAKVPLDNTAAEGSADSHWRESVFGDELMTPVATGAMPLSSVTAAALRDLGYGVNLAAAQTFALSLSGLAGRTGVRAPLGGDVAFFRLPPGVTTGVRR